ncbi:hypothetical protein NVS55_04885 [Myxococcus stipitatus]
MLRLGIFRRLPSVLERQPRKVRRREQVSELIVLPMPFEDDETPQTLSLP